MELEYCLDLCVNKVRKNIHRMTWGLREYPSTPSGYYFDVPKEKTINFFHIMNWTASFYTGMALLALERTERREFLVWLYEQSPLYYSKVFDHPEETMHDLGFLYGLYSLPLFRLTGDPIQRNISLKAADELAKRYILNGNYIKAWGRMDGKISPKADKSEALQPFFTESIGLAIIDCMMNLPLLFWASQETGNDFYQSIAMAHADTTLKHFIRNDGSVYHAYRFHPETGHPIGGCNYCGYSDESYWARGTAWAIYGFALAYGYTKKTEYIQTSLRLAHCFIGNLKENGIPVWDFKLPDHEPKGEDSSAAAIAACGIMEILKYRKDEPLLQRTVDRILSTLTTEEYTNFDDECPGVLKHQNGNDTYTIFGDYFYMEALAKKNGKALLFW